VNWRYTF
jgi:hypothetical protein